MKLSFRLPTRDRVEQIGARVEQVALEVETVRGLVARIRKPIATPVPQITGNQRGCTLIYSAGRTATQWLTSALNLHPEVFFSHGLDLNPAKRRSTAEYIAASQHRADSKADFDFSRVDDYFDRLERLGDYKILGNVHGLKLAPDQRYARTYRTCALVRHPILRVQSFVNKWSASRWTDVSSPAFVNDHSRAISAQYSVQDDPAAIPFIHAIDVTTKFDRAYSEMNIPIFQMERFSDSNFFLHIFDYVTFGKVHPDLSYIESVKSLPPVDPLAKHTIALQQFQAWQPWQRDYFLSAVARDDMTETYRALGYSF